MAKDTKTPGFSESLLLRCYLVLHFLVVPFSGLSFDFHEAGQEQGFSAPSSWFLEPLKSRRLVSQQERLPEQSATIAGLQDYLFLPILVISCIFLCFSVVRPKLFLHYRCLQLEGG